MLDIIFLFKFVHVVAAGAMFGCWLCIFVLMLQAHHSHNPSVVALTARFIVNVEKFVMIAALALPAASGFPLAWTIGVSALDEFWIVVALVVYAIVAAAWFGALRTEITIRNLAQEAALAPKPLPQRYRRLFWTWAALAAVILPGMIALFFLMIWQPRLD